MKLIDKHIVRELVRIALLACASVVVIYLLIDLFEELSYFTGRKASLFVILLHYLYMLPATISLLYPVSVVLAVFVVYGQMTRYRELHALESAGVSVRRLFLPAVGVGLATVVLYLFCNEFVTIPANAALTDLRRNKIERRQSSQVTKRQNLYFVGEGGRVFYIRELGSDGVMRDFSMSVLDSARRLVRRYDVGEATWRDKAWFGKRVAERTFDPLGNEEMVKYDSMKLDAITETPQDLAYTSRPVDETSTRALRGYIARMKKAGENVAKEEVEYYYRFSYSLIGLVVILLGLPLSARLRKGGVMFGLGLGLLLSFMYWGAIQTSRAFGTSHIISTALAAWLPNIVFGSIAIALVLDVDRKA